MDQRMGGDRISDLSIDESQDFAHRTKDSSNYCDFTIRLVIFYFRYTVLISDCVSYLRTCLNVVYYTAANNS